MTDEVSLGKARIVLLPVILGLVIIFFLKLFSIKVSLLVWVVLLVVTFLISLLLSMKSKVSISSKLPTTKSILGPIAWTIVILAVLVGLIAIFCTTGDEDFKSGEPKKGYSYTGNYTIENEVLEFSDTLLISNRVDRVYTNYNLYVIQGSGTVDVTVGNHKFPSISFSDNTKISVGFKNLGLDYSKRPMIWINDRRTDYPTILLNLDNPHYVKMSVSCASDKCVIDDIFLGN